MKTNAGAYLDDISLQKRANPVAWQARQKYDAADRNMLMKKM